jgi:hypothetical protein
MNPTNTPQSAAAEPRVRSMASESLLEQIVDETDRRELVRFELDSKRFEHSQRLAAMMFKAGYFTDLKSIEQACAKIVIGEAWGMTPADSIRFIYVVNGKPAIENEYYAACMMDAGWSWKISWIGQQGANCKGVRLYPHFKGEPVLDGDGKPAVVEFTEQMASAITVWEKGQRVCILQKAGPWSDGFRGNMMLWRAISNLRRWYCPNVLRGALLKDEAESIDVSELQVSTAASPFPSKRASLLAKIEQAIATPTTEQVTPSDSQMKPSEQEDQLSVKSVTAQLEEAVVSGGEDLATKMSADQLPTFLQPTKITLKKISDMEAALSTDKWKPFMTAAGYAKVSDIMTEEEAQTILKQMRTCLTVK